MEQEGVGGQILTRFLWLPPSTQFCAASRVPIGAAAASPRGRGKCCEFSAQDKVVLPISREYFGLFTINSWRWWWPSPCIYPQHLSPGDILLINLEVPFSIHIAVFLRIENESSVSCTILWPSALSSKAILHSSDFSNHNCLFYLSSALWAKEKVFK